MSKSNYYYSLADDIEENQWASFFFIYGGRKCGKTYSSLKYVTENNIPFAFVKRTKDDILTLCAGRRINWAFNPSTAKANEGQKKNEVEIDTSPFAPLNRDYGWNIKAYLLDAKAGIGVFIRENKDGVPYGKPLGYLLALSSAAKYKGFDLTAQFTCKDFFIIFDEFVPPAGTKKIAGADEGDVLFDLYETLARDRVTRGQNPIKLICLANAENIICPVIMSMNCLDILAEMSMKHFETYCNKEKGLFIHKIQQSKEFIEVEGSAPIYKLMKDTAWHDKSLKNEFDVDFSYVTKDFTLKGYRCLYCIINKINIWFVYWNQDKNKYVMTKKTPPQSPKEIYNMAIEGDRCALTMSNHLIYLKRASFIGNTVFEDYSMKEFVYNWLSKYEKHKG